MKKILTALFLIGMGFAPSYADALIFNPGSVGAPLEVSIAHDGKIKLSGAYVSLISGGIIFTKTEWEQSTLRWTIVTNDKTSFTRRFGGVSNIKEINAGDYVSVEGVLGGGGDSIRIDAVSVKNWSNAKELDTWSGIVRRSAAK